MNDMTPKETEFMGVRYKSRAEARFAACLLNSKWNDFEYEPEKFRLWTDNNNGWVFDFVIRHGNGDMSAIEFKPAPPSSDYMNTLGKRFLELHEMWGVQCDFYITWFDFFGKKYFQEQCPLTGKTSHFQWGLLRFHSTGKSGIAFECKRHVLSMQFFEPGINARFDLRDATYP